MLVILSVSLLVDTELTLEKFSLRLGKQLSPMLQFESGIIVSDLCRTFCV
jgi:hypothetical protein